MLEGKYMKQKLKLKKEVTIKTYLLNLGIVLFLIIIFSLISNHTNKFNYIFPDCNFKNWLHLYCPGCGGTRACISLMKFHFIDSICSNPIVIYFASCMLYYYIKIGYLLIKNHGKLVYIFNTTWLFVAIAVMIIFFITRNLFLVIKGYDYLGDIGNDWLLK